MEANLDAQEHHVDQPLLPSKHEQHNNSSKLKDDDSTHISFPPEDTGGKRPYRDSIFTFLFLGTVFTTYGFGVVAFIRADFNLDSKLRLSKFNPNTNQCEIVQQGRQEDSDIDDSVFSALVTMILPLSALVLTLPAGLLLIYLLRRYTRGVLLVSAPLMPLLPLGCSVYWITWCFGLNREFCVTSVRMSTHVFYIFNLPVISALLAFQLWQDWSRDSFKITVQVFKMATHALKDHFFLLILNAVLLLGSMVLVNGPIFSFIWYALNNGKVVPNFDVVNDPSKGCDQATGYPCCHEERPGWTAAYITLACFTVLWVLTVTTHLQILVVSGTVSQWYFAPTGSSTLGNIKRSLRNAFGPSFGTACNLGTIVTMLVVALLGALKKVTDKVLKNSSRRQGMISSILQECFSWMSQFPECNPRFAPYFAAISGESFWESSKKSNNLLRRNSPSINRTNSSNSLMYLSPMGMILTYATLQSLVVYEVLEYFSNKEFLMEFLMNIMIALLCFLVTIIGLCQFCRAIFSVVGTLYICYAMEKDVGEISKPEVCHAITLLPPWNSLPENGAKLAGSLAPEEQT